MSKVKESAALDLNKFVHKAGAGKKPSKKVPPVTPSTTGEVENQSVDPSISNVSSPPITSAKGENKSNEKVED